jgi:hypothetical protein
MCILWMDESREGVRERERKIIKGISLITKSHINLHEKAFVNIISSYSSPELILKF